MDATLLSNQFIDVYMKDANDAQIKIYLYLVRTISANQETSISKIADQFNHTEKDVIRALIYWEKKKLLLLDYDSNEVIIGIHLCELPTPVSKVEMPVKKITTEVPSNHLPPEKPSYSLDQMKAFQEQAEAQQLLFVIEQYIGKPLGASEVRTIFYIYDVLGFSTDLIDYLVEYCVGRGKKDFRYIEKVAISWAEAHVKTPKEASKVSGKYEKSVYTIMSALGKSTSPVAKEVDFITKWTKHYGYTLDIILEACNRTVLAVDSHRFEYADSILTRWFKENIHHVKEITEADAKFKKSKTPVSVSKNSFNQFQQNDYDFDEIERKLLGN